MLVLVMLLYISGRAGTGKTSSMAMLALDWVNENDEIETNLSQFDLVFLIELRYVNDNSSLEQIIIKQHGLKGKNVSESQIRFILEEQSVLLILDGYDEYQKGTNSDIDSAIKDTVGDCFLILTCRDGDYISKGTLSKFDCEIEILGFTPFTMFQCAAKYLESKEMANRLISEASRWMIRDLLQIPIILLMVCVLYFKEKKLPRSHTAIIDKIVELLLDRSTLKHFGAKCRQVPGLRAKLYQLGELAWKTLKSKTRQLLLPQVLHFKQRHCYGGEYFPDHVLSTREGNVFTRICDSVQVSRGAVGDILSRSCLRGGQPVEGVRRRGGEDTFCPSHVWRVWKGVGT